MKIRTTAFIVCIAAIAGAAGGNEVHFEDPNLQAIVEETLQVWYPTSMDMLGLPSLYGSARGINDLTGLESATNLQSLDLQHNEISDISPLSGLTNLLSLRLNTNRISDITPLSDLTGLQLLDVHDNRIGDISALTGLTNLQELTLLSNQISDISSLSGLVNLQLLRLDANRINSLSALSHLTNLRTLTASSNSISSVSALAGLEDLEYVNLYYNQLSDISALGGLHNLQRLRLSGNQITDISPLTALTSLSYVDLRGNPLNQEAYDSYIPQIIAFNPGIELNYNPQDYNPQDYNPQGQFRVSISSTAGGSVVRPAEGQLNYDKGQTVWLEAQADSCYYFVGWSGTFSSSDNPAFLTVYEDHSIEAVFACLCETLYVDHNAPGDPAVADGTIEHPFGEIQKAIEAASEGATVLVRAGVYRENIDLMGKNIRLIGLDPNGAALPVIEGDGTGTIVSFVNGEDPNCLLMGFVITGRGDQTAGAIACVQSSPTIANCLIVGNRITTPEGAAMRFEDSQAIMVNCTMADNHGGVQGGGLLLIDSQIVMANSIVWGNRPEGIAFIGVNKPLITYCNIQGGWPDVGNIDTDPLFARHGYWIDPADLEIVAEPEDPNAVWVEGDYHLRSQAGRWDPQTGLWVQDDVTSPCIDAGDPTAPVADEPKPHGNTVNMGAYGGTNQASLGRDL